MDRDFALLLAAANKTKLELAQSLLKAAGIPTLIDASDSGAAVGTYLGLGVDFSTTKDLYVPRSALSRARDVLREAWGIEPS